MACTWPSSPIVEHDRGAHAGPRRDRVQASESRAWPRAQVVALTITPASAAAVGPVERNVRVDEQAVPEEAEGELAAAHTALEDRFEDFAPLGGENVAGRLEGGV